MLEIHRHFVEAFISILVFIRICDCNCVLDDLVTNEFLTYKKEVRPYCFQQGNNTVQVNMDIALRQIVNLDEPKQILQVNVWMRLDWIDCRLQWNASNYSNIDMFAIPQDKIWIPDITLYDTIDVSGLPGIDDYLAQITSDGNVSYRFPSVIKSVCPIDVRFFPFDIQTCKLVFGSWIYSGVDVYVQNRYTQLDLSSYVNNSEWAIEQTSVVTEVTYYSKDYFPTVNCVIELRRKPLFYTMNMLFPCVLVSFIALLGFVLPPDSGEKVNLQITVLLSLAVFQLVVVDMIPASGESAPLLAYYFLISMVLVGISCLMTVFVLQVHFKGHSDAKMSPWVKKYILKPMAKLACIRGNNAIEIYTHPNHDTESIKESYIKNGKDCHKSVSSKINGHVYKSKGLQHDHALLEQPRTSPTPATHGWERQLLETLMDIKNCSSAVVENMDDKELNSDWNTLSLALDRVFLVCYLVLTTITSLAILLHLTYGPT